MRKRESKRENDIYRERKNSLKKERDQQFVATLRLQVVDGVISSDSDAFLYGAGTVYRQVSTRSGGMCKR